MRSTLSAAAPGRPRGLDPNLAGAPTMQVYPFAVGSDGSLTALTPVNDGVGGANAGELGIATVTFK